MQRLWLWTMWWYTLAACSSDSACKTDCGESSWERPTDPTDGPIVPPSDEATETSQEIPSEVVVTVSLPDALGPDVRLSAELASWHYPVHAALELGGEAASAPVSGTTATLGLPALSGEELAELDAPGIGYFLYLYDDTDGDGSRQADELILAIPARAIVYQPGGTTDADGDGWISAVFGSAGDETDLDEAVELYDVRPHGPWELAGTHAVQEGDVPDRLGLVSLYDQPDAPLPPSPFDIPFDDPWALSVSGGPGEGRAVPTVQGLDVMGAFEMLVAYDDLDGNGGYTADADAVAVPVCHQGLPVTLVHYDAVDLIGALTLGSYHDLGTDMHLGWNLFAGYGLNPSAPIEWVSDADALELVVDPDCSFLFPL